MLSLLFSLKVAESGGARYGVVQVGGLAGSIYGSFFGSLYTTVRADGHSEEL